MSTLTGKTIDKFPFASSPSSSSFLPGQAATVSGVLMARPKSRDHLDSVAGAPAGGRNRLSVTWHLKPEYHTCPMVGQLEPATGPPRMLASDGPIGERPGRPSSRHAGAGCCTAAAPGPTNGATAGRVLLAEREAGESSRGLLVDLVPAKIELMPVDQSGYAQLVHDQAHFHQCHMRQLSTPNERSSSPNLYTKFPTSFV
ncbi:unnamed protein product [Protopolystoma xenopodis]|uniref:Uncharacterized protein n=1 Tax=Protopolystoma xenopodis TaxID=117903 RepID=A0A3S5BQ20_9PLAT|nr:unnamed protein product [Protopolystoma xenopodis]